VVDGAATLLVHEIATDPSGDVFAVIEPDWPELEPLAVTLTARAAVTTTRTKMRHANFISWRGSDRAQLMRRSRGLSGQPECGLESLPWSWFKVSIRHLDKEAHNDANGPRRTADDDSKSGVFTGQQENI